MVRIVGMHIAQVINAHIFVQIKQQFDVWYFTYVVIRIQFYTDTIIFQLHVQCTY